MGNKELIPATPLCPRRTSQILLIQKGIKSFQFGLCGWYDLLSEKFIVLALFIFQRRIKSIQQLAQMKPKERRSMLRFLSEDQYNVVTKVMSSMPLVELKVRSEGN